MWILSRGREQINLKKKVDQKIKQKFSMKNQEYLDQLNPSVRGQFISFIKDIESMGYKVVITSGYRSFQKQASLKAQDSRNAAPGFSSHNYGTALDLVLVKDGKMIQKNAPRSEWIDTGVPRLAKKKYGMRWGGDFPGYHDPVHFDFNNKYDTKKLYAQAIRQFGSPDKVKGNQLKLA